MTLSVTSSSLTFDGLGAAIRSAPRLALDDLFQAVNAAWSSGDVSEEEAGALFLLVHERRAARPVVPAVPRGGSRPRSDASKARRRANAYQGLLPRGLAAKFTEAENAVLSVIAGCVRRFGFCDWPVRKLAAVAGVSERSVQNAVKRAEVLGLLHVQRRRVAGWCNETNLITVVSREWSSWLHHRGRGGGAKPFTPRNTEHKSSEDLGRESYGKGGPRDGKGREGGASGGAGLFRGASGAFERKREGHECR